MGPDLLEVGVMMALIESKSEDAIECVSSERIGAEASDCLIVILLMRLRLYFGWVRRVCVAGEQMLAKSELSVWTQELRLAKATELINNRGIR